VLRIAPASLLAYWPLSESSGTTIGDLSGNGRNGAYSGVDLGKQGIGDGRTCPLFDGINDFGNVYSAGLAGSFNPEEGSCALWAQADPSVWADGANRTLFRLATDNNNALFFRKVVAGGIDCRYTAGGTAEPTTVTTIVTNWFHLAMTWSKAADQVKVYYNGSQSGATRTTLGTWAGSLAATTCVVGALSTGATESWSGYLAHAALWSTPLTAADVARLATL
jgi:hypothetical protein